LGRVYYSTWRAKGPGVARKILDDIAQLPLEIVTADLELTRTAAELRAEHKLPYIDCFAAALAADRKASLATSDKDFTHVEKRLEIVWTLGP
jgi:predicted nucleic acid-binding protein